jgi:hypothetical protein
VIQVIAGPDGIVRSAIVQSNGVERHRPSHKLFLLESVRIREDAPVTTERRAGDVGKSKIPKVVNFSDPLESKRINPATPVTRGRESDKKEGAKPRRLFTKKVFSGVERTCADAPHFTFQFRFPFSDFSLCLTWGRIAGNYRPVA